MRIYNTYRATSFTHEIEHDFKAKNHQEAIEKCKEYNMPARSQLWFIKDSGKLKGTIFIDNIGN